MLFLKRKTFRFPTVEQLSSIFAYRTTNFKNAINIFRKGGCSNNGYSIVYDMSDQIQGNTT